MIIGPWEVLGYTYTLHLLSTIRRHLRESLVWFYILFDFAAIVVGQGTKLTLEYRKTTLVPGTDEVFGLINWASSPLTVSFSEKGKIRVQAAR